MSSRDAVLAAVRAARPSAAPRPDLAAAVARFAAPADPVRGFTEAAEAAGADVVIGDRDALPDLIAAALAGGRHVSALDADARRTLADLSPHSFADTDVFVCEAVLGVAEDGAVWLPLSRLGARSAVFLATHVVVILDRTMVVPNLHAAYAAIDLSTEGFGVFVAGPSKTADIEQALVIGAHGARSCTVIVT